MKKLVEENEKMKKLLKIEGITLIALTISFIIMIIIAGVIIGTLNKAGVIEKSKLASEKYKNSSDEEDGTINQHADLIGNYDTKIATTRDENQLDNPVGTIISYMGTKAPNGYLFCNGKTYNINDYRNLAEQIKNNFESYNYFGGDGTTTFAIPNLQGEFLRGYSTNPSSSVTNGISTENIGKHQDATFFQSMRTNNRYLLVGTNTTGDDGGASNIDLNIHNQSYVKRYQQSSIASFSNDPGYYYTSRPTNTSVLYCIKY